jgi:hypothetical protein
MGQPYSVSIDMIEANYMTAFPLCEVICTATDHIAITEVYADIYVNASATAMVFGWGRPAAAGVTPVGATVLKTDDEGNNAGVFANVAMQWATPPTAPTTFNRRATLTSPATGRGEVRWFFDPGFIIIPSNTAVLWCINAGTTRGNIDGVVTFSVDG